MTIMMSLVIFCLSITASVSEHLNFTHFLFIAAKLKIENGDTRGFQFIFIKFLVFVLAFSNAISPLAWNFWNCIYVNMYFPFVQFSQINFIFLPVTIHTRSPISDTLDSVFLFLCGSRPHSHETSRQGRRLPENWFFFIKKSHLLMNFKLFSISIFVFKKKTKDRI